MLNNESLPCTTSLYCTQLLVGRPFCEGIVEGVNHFVSAAAAAPLHCTVDWSGCSRLRTYGKVRDSS